MNTPKYEREIKLRYFQEKDPLDPSMFYADYHGVYIYIYIYAKNPKKKRFQEKCGNKWYFVDRKKPEDASMYGGIHKGIYRFDFIKITREDLIKNGIPILTEEEIRSEISKRGYRLPRKEYDDDE